MLFCRCVFCDHEWETRNNIKPEKCAKCNKKNWDFIEWLKYRKTLEGLKIGEKSTVFCDDERKKIFSFAVRSYERRTRFAYKIIVERYRLIIKRME